MAVSLEEVDQFHRYATAVIENGGAESLESLVRQWQESQAEYQETSSEIASAIENMEAGRGIPLADVAREIREEFGFSTPE